MSVEHERRSASGGAAKRGLHFAFRRERGTVDAVLLHQTGAAQQYAHAVDPAFQAAARKGDDVRRDGHLQSALGGCLAHGARQRVLASLLQGQGQAQ